MIKHLSITNLLLIEKIEINIGSGLCVLTGETGAGKCGTESLIRKSQADELHQRVAGEADRARN